MCAALYDWRGEVFFFGVNERRRVDVKLAIGHKNLVAPNIKLNSIMSMMMMIKVMLKACLFVLKYIRIHG